MALIAGWGFRAGAQQHSFADCWEQACQRLGLLELAPSELEKGNWRHAVLASRLQTSAGSELRRWAASATPQAEFLAYEEASIQQIKTESLSLRIQQRFGVGSVSEALALCGAEQWSKNSATVMEIPLGHRLGPSETCLILPRIVSADRHATLAIARGMSASHSMKTGVYS